MPHPEMSTQTRLIALLFLLVAVFAVILGLLRLNQKDESERYIREVTAERTALSERLLDLTGQTLRNFADDYSNWGEMFQFVDKPDPAWAAVNIDASLANFNAHAAWVLCADGRQAHGAIRKLDPSLRTLPLPARDLLPVLQRVKFAHFFLHTPSGLLEIRTAPIQPSEDTARLTPPHGWFLVARLWDEDFQRNLSQVLESDLTLLEPGATTPPPKSDYITLQRPLPGWSGHPVATLQLLYHLRGASQLERDNFYELILFLGFGAIVIAAATLGVSLWVLSPLRRLELSLAENSILPSAAWRRNPTSSADSPSSPRPRSTIARPSSARSTTAAASKPRSAKARRSCASRAN